MAEKKPTSTPDSNAASASDGAAAEQASPKPAPSNEPRSMTGFARQEKKLPWGSLIWEIRSVNHRYLEPHFRLPDTLRQLEQPLRDQVRKRLHRGKLEATLHVQTGQASDAELGIDNRLAQQVANAVLQLNDLLTSAAPINAMDLLKWPGVIKNQDIDTETMQAEILALFNDSLRQLLENRSREGTELKRFIEQRLDAISVQVAKVRKLMPEILAAQREKLHTRLESLAVELDPERVEQEIVLLAQKADVDEELDRLDTHVIEVRRTLNQKGAVGRRLDFLMQELNREANTLSSKSIVSETTQAAVELKVLIEQMREQIQNIE